MGGNTTLRNSRQSLKTSSGEAAPAERWHAMRFEAAAHVAGEPTKHANAEASAVLTWTPH